jgi:hypothetical protein
MNEKELIFINRKMIAKENNAKYKAYLFVLTAPLFVYHSLATKDYWTLLFISCLALYVPILWTAFAIYLCVKTHSHFLQSNLNQKESVQSSIVHSLQFNKLDELTVAIEENPEILYCDFQRRSLMNWCRYYKNTRALEVVIQLMKKYPKGSPKSSNESMAA